MNLFKNKIGDGEKKNLKFDMKIREKMETKIRKEIRVDFILRENIEF